MPSSIARPLAIFALIMAAFALACANDGGPNDQDDPMSGAEALCWNTGGAWESGACECAQDGATLNHVFDSQLGCKAPNPPAANARETLCWDSGGAWESGACECAQDGATLYHIFDEDLGCIAPEAASIEALCWDTGGAWENGACDCAQDGATLNHVFDSHVGCRAPNLQ
ncbi:MAG: hypothetical protein H0U74_17770 [Bradymonadaceae bacterium]|nr:hypothetical protein [Lujinxingiaceae bacterium]